MWDNPVHNPPMFHQGFANAAIGVRRYQQFAGIHFHYVDEKVMTGREGERGWSTGDRKIGFNRTGSSTFGWQDEKSLGLAGLAGSHLGNYCMPWQTIPSFAAVAKRSAKIQPSQSIWVMRFCLTRQMSGPSSQTLFLYTPAQDHVWSFCKAINKNPHRSRWF